MMNIQNPWHVYDAIHRSLGHIYACKTSYFALTIICKQCGSCLASYRSLSDTMLARHPTLCLDTNTGAECQQHQQLHFLFPHIALTSDSHLKRYAS